MSDFHEERISPKISYGATGGPKRKTEIVELNSGFEERNSPWSQARRTYDIAYGLRNTDDVYDVMAFFEMREGSLYGFRYKDWSDFKTTKPLTENLISPTDQLLGSTVGEFSTFQLVKIYGDSSNQITRVISKPVAGTIQMAIDSIVIFENADFTVDYTTGLVAFGIRTGSDQIVTAGFEFDVPVRFASDEISINLGNFEKGEIPGISLIEVLTPTSTTEARDNLIALAQYNFLQSIDINTAVNIHWTTTWSTI